MPELDMSTHTQCNPVLDWERLAEALRTELQETSALFILLNEQQQRILHRDTPALSANTQALSAQSATAAEAREERLQVQKRLCQLEDIPPVDSLEALLPQLPVVIQPLFQAFVEEAKSLQNRIQRRARQNQQMMLRASEANESLIRLLRPDTPQKTYTPKGKLASRLSRSGHVMHTAV